jgi:hypothetical protein
MPLPAIAVFLGGTATGFVVSSGAENISNAVKWGAVLGGIYLITKVVK